MSCGACGHENPTLQRLVVDSQIFTDLAFPAAS
jgi:hypothetical protein